MKKTYLRPEAVTIRFATEGTMLTVSGIDAHNTYSPSDQLSTGRQQGGWSSDDWSNVDDE